MHLPRKFITRLIATLLLPIHLFAQDIAGLWTGYLESNGISLPYEVVISQNNDKLTGYALTAFLINGMENIGIKTIELKNKKGKFAFEDHELVYHNYTIPPRRVKLIGSLLLKVQGNDMTLSGSFYTRSLDFRSANNDSYIGNITLKKQDPKLQTRLVTKLEELNLFGTLSFIQENSHKEASTAEIAFEEPPPLTIKRQREIGIPHHIVIKTSPTVLLPNRNAGFMLPPVIAPVEMVVNKKIVAEIEPEELEKQKALASRKAPEKKTEVSYTAQPKEIVQALPPIEAKLAKPVQTKPVPIKEVFTLPAAAALAERKTDIIRSIYFSADSIVLSLYDNGTIDGDTVSIVLNGKVIIGRKGLSASAIRTTIQWTPEMGDSLQLVMYAENLGSIPPNTGLLIVQEGEQRSEVRFSGDMQRSSAVILRKRR